VLALVITSTRKKETMKLRKVEVATLGQLDQELGTTVHMDTYESLAGLVYESENAEDENFYDSDGNILYFASLGEEV
jgi:hypothetical protein